MSSPELTVMRCVICPDPDALLLDWDLLITHLREAHGIDVTTWPVAPPEDVA